MAFNWLVDDDAFGICPDDEKLIQRYVMAVFYFSTDGSSWTECGQVGGCAGTNFLSGTHECDWAGISCNNDDCVTEMVFGEYCIDDTYHEFFILQSEGKSKQYFSFSTCTMNE